MDKLKKLIKLFLIYTSVPLRIVFVILIMIIGIALVKKTKQECNIITIISSAFKMMLYIMSYNINISDNDYKKYMNYLYSDEKFICVFNHSTLIDGHLLFTTFPRMGITLFKQKVLDYINCDDNFNKKIGGIFVDMKKKTNVTNKIKDIVSNRENGDPILFIAPSACHPPDEKNNISKFIKTGAFVIKCKILPILIKFEDDSLHYNCDNKESISHAYFKLFLVNNYKINIKVGDIIEPIEEESIIQYRDRVYNIMNEQYKDMKC